MCQGRMCPSQGSVHVTVALGTLLATHSPLPHGGDCREVSQSPSRLTAVQTDFSSGTPEIFTLVSCSRAVPVRQGCAFGSPIGSQQQLVDLSLMPLHSGGVAPELVTELVTCQPADGEG